MLVRTEYRTRDGLTLVADTGGPEDGPIILLMHGGGQTRHSWSGATRALARRGYRVVNLDLRGHGESEWSADKAYSLDVRVQDAIDILGEPGRPYAMVGASLGGAVALHAAGQEMRPAAIVLVDIVPDLEVTGVDRIRDFMFGSMDGFADLEEAADAVAHYHPERPRPNDPGGLMKNLRLKGDGRLYWHWDPAILSGDVSIEICEVLRSSARKVGCRPEIAVLLVRGMVSDVIGDDGVDAFRAQVPQLEVADVSGAGHMVAGDRNDAFNAAVIEFLSRKMPV